VAGAPHSTSDGVGTPTALARRELGAGLLAANIGISGANVVLITNDGNADMVTRCRRRDRGGRR